TTTASTPLHLPAAFSFFLLPRPPRSPLFPYTTLFRSPRHRGHHRRGMGVDPPLESHDGVRVLTRRTAGDEAPARGPHRQRGIGRDRKSTRLNSSHVSISYAVFCLKKKTKDLMKRAVTC